MTEIQKIKVGVDNCYLIRGETTIVIDGGMPGSFAEFKKAIQKRDIDPKEISALILTHCHWDHIGCAKAIKEMSCAQVIAHKNEKEIMEKGIRTMPPAVTLWGIVFGSFLNKWSKKFEIEPCDVDIALVDEEMSLEKFGIDGKIVHTPGHSIGSISVILSSGEAFVGDMAMNGPPLTLGPNLPIFAENNELLLKSWKKLIDLGVKQIFPAHGNDFPIEKLLGKIER